jgi:hypothetical protein
VSSIAFSGENLDGKLTIERFLDFQEQLQREILTLEFLRKPPVGDESGRMIREKDFADLLLTYADYTPKKRSAVMKRVKKKYHSVKNMDDDEAVGGVAVGGVEAVTNGVSLEDYIQIFSLLIHIDDVDKVSFLWGLF